jgi:hypothetical protein
MRAYVVCISFAVSFTGCIYGEMDASTDTGASFSTSNGSGCENLVTAVCRDCPDNYCDYYSDAVDSMSEAECGAIYEDLLQTGC